MKIAFVSRGNAIRSLMAEAVARHLLSSMGIKVEVFSAGTEPRKEAHPLTLKVLEERGYPTEGLHPKPLEKIPYGKIDVLITMCNEAREKCEFTLAHKRRENWLIDEPDKREDSFRKTLQIIEEHIRELLKLSQ